MILPSNCTHNIPPILAHWFGKKWIAFADSKMVCGITYKGASYITSEQKDTKYFLLPKGYSIKNFIPQIK